MVARLQELQLVVVTILVAQCRQKGLGGFLGPSCFEALAINLRSRDHELQRSWIASRASQLLVGVTTRLQPDVITYAAMYCSCNSLSGCPGGRVPQGVGHCWV